MANRPKPTELKKAQGNPGKRKLNEQEPTPEIVQPVMPDYITTPARKWWKRLAPMLLRNKVLTEADHIALVLLCEQLSQAGEAIKIITREGLLIKKKILDRSGKEVMTIPVIHPACRVQSDTLKHARSLLAEFGITPASRTKVTKAFQPEPLKRDVLSELRERAKRSR